VSVSFPKIPWNSLPTIAFYSTLAGFVEPGETFEEAVAREIYEESGVKVHNVVYHSAQPWPYPGNIMMGFYAQEDSTKPIYLDYDAELPGVCDSPSSIAKEQADVCFSVDAKWFTRAEVQEVLSHPDGTNIAARDYKQLDNIVSGTTTDTGTSQAAVGMGKATVNTQPPFRVPPVTSIAGTLISEWVYGKSRL
jgi:NAD+ diphosphatase